MTITVHGTCVAMSGWGVLLRGPSGSGKSDLALRLIDRGAELVADDQVVIEATGDGLRAGASVPLVGLIEVRGLGLVRQPARPMARLALVVDLVPQAKVDRMPEDAIANLCGVTIPHMKLWAFEVSAPLKIEWFMAIVVGERDILR